MALFLCSAILVGAPARQAKADHPVVVAVIGAAGTVIAGATAAGATVAAAAIGAAAVIATSGDNGDSSGKANGGSTDGNDGGDGDGGNSDGSGSNKSSGSNTSNVTIDEGDIPAEFQAILDREISLSAKHDLGEQGALRASARLEYLMDGDIKRAKDGVSRFSIQDGAGFRFEVTGVENAKDAPIRLMIEELSISTEDVPQTRGLARVTLTALQDGKEIWSWEAQLVQGKRAKLRGPDQIQTAIVDNKPNRLTIRDIDLNVPYAAPGLDGTTIVEIMLSVDGVGERK